MQQPYGEVHPTGMLLLRRSPQVINCQPIDSVSAACNDSHMTYSGDEYLSADDAAFDAGDPWIEWNEVNEYNDEMGDDE